MGPHDRACVARDQLQRRVAVAVLDSAVCAGLDQAPRQRAARVARRKVQRRVALAVLRARRPAHQARWPAATARNPSASSLGHGASNHCIAWRSGEPEGAHPWLGWYWCSRTGQNMPECKVQMRSCMQSTPGDACGSAEPGTMWRRGAPARARPRPRAAAPPRSPRGCTRPRRTAACGPPGRACPPPCRSPGSPPRPPGRRTCAAAPKASCGDCGASMPTCCPMPSLPQHLRGPGAALGCIEQRVDLRRRRGPCARRLRRHGGTLGLSGGGAHVAQLAADLGQPRGVVPVLHQRAHAVLLDVGEHRLQVGVVLAQGEDIIMPQLAGSQADAAQFIRSYGTQARSVQPHLHTQSSSQPGSEEWCPWPQTKEAQLL